MTILSPLLTFALLVPTAADPSADTAALVSATLAAHPDLDALARRLDALAEGPVRVSAWSDPQVAVEYSNMPVLAPWPGNHPMSGIQLKLQQTLPFPTKLFARRDAALAEQRAMEPLIDEAKNRLAAEVRRSMVRYARVQALRTVAEEQAVATHRLLDAVRARYEVGRAEQQDVLRLELLEQRLLQDVTDLDEEARAQQVQLNALAGRAPGAPLSITNDLEGPASVDDADALLARAEQQRPLLEAIERQREAAERQADAARQEVWPDVMAWVGYRVRLPAGADAGDNFVTAGVSVPIVSPWSGGRVDGAARAADATAAARREERAAVLRSLRGTITATLVRFHRARARTNAHDDVLLPAAQRTLASTFSAYGLDRATVSDLFLAEVDVLNLARARIESRTTAAQAAIDLAEMTGVAVAASFTPAEEQP